MADRIWTDRSQANRFLKDRKETPSMPMNEGSKLPRTIVGALPSPEKLEHRIVHQNYTPDGTVYRCCCGWESNLCETEEAFQLAWMEHL